MSTHLTIKNENRPNPRTGTPEKKGPFLCGASSWRYDLFCGYGWKHNEKGSVKADYTI